MTSLFAPKQSLVEATIENNGDRARQFFKENEGLKEDVNLSDIIQEELI